MTGRRAGHGTARGCAALRDLPTPAGLGSGIVVETLIFGRRCALTSRSERDVYMYLSRYVHAC